jgi:uncharacterized protein YifN (PemK superfamily)
MQPPRKSMTATPAMRAAAAAHPAPGTGSRVRSQLTRDTRPGEVYWCDFNPTNLVPEFDAPHPVVVVRGGRIARDIHVVLPLTKADQVDNPHGYRLTHNPNPGSSDVSWAVCNHLYAVASERLKPLRDAKGNRRTPQKLHPDDLREISARTRRALATFLSLGVAPEPGSGPLATGR